MFGRGLGFLFLLIQFFYFILETFLLHPALEDTLSFLVICLFLGWIVVVTNCCIGSLKIFSLFHGTKIESWCRLIWLYLVLLCNELGNRLPRCMKGTSTAIILLCSMITVVDHLL
jgi:hypothetical protein